MPTIIIHAPNQPSRSIQISGSQRLLDACDEANAPIPFSCRGATCGTCLVQVLEGEEWLEPIDGHERRMLLECDGARDKRLACAVLVKAGKGVVVFRVCGKTPTT